MSAEPTIYLNHAGTSWPKPRAVQVAAAAAWNGDPAEWSDVFEQAHREVAEFFHLARPDSLLLTPGCTSALATAVSDHAWQSGDRVLTSGLEHHGLHRPLVQLAQRGVEVEVLPRSDREPLALDALEGALRRGRVRLVAVTAASNVTGELLPLAEIIELARRFDALTLIDAAQIAGWWDLDLPKLGCDLLAFAGHKGLQAPWGIGGLYIAPQVRLHSPRAQCEVPRPSAPPRSTPPSCAERPGYCDVGSVDRIALGGLAAAVGWLGQPERSDRLAHGRTLAGRLFDFATSHPRIIPHGPAAPAARLPTVAVTFHDLAPGQVAEWLAARGIVVAAGLQCAPLAHRTIGTAPDGVVRFSFGPGTELHEVERVIKVLGELLA